MKKQKQKSPNKEEREKRRAVTSDHGQIETTKGTEKLKRKRKELKKDLQENFECREEGCEVLQGSEIIEGKQKREKTGEVACGLECIIIAYGIYVQQQG